MYWCLRPIPAEVSTICLAYFFYDIYFCFVSPIMIGYRVLPTQDCRYLGALYIHNADDMYGGHLGPCETSL